MLWGNYLVLQLRKCWNNPSKPGRPGSTLQVVGGCLPSKPPASHWRPFTGEGAPHKGSPTPDQPVDDASSRGAEPPGRLNLLSETSIRRVAPAPGGGERSTTSPLGQDSLAYLLPDGLLYAFPPLPLIRLVLQLTLQEDHKILLIVSFWPGRR